MERSAVTLPLAVASAAAGLAALAPPATVLPPLTTALTPGADPAAFGVAVAAAVAWALVGWLVLSVLLVVAARAPGAAGRAAGRLAARVSPAVVRRVLGAGTAAGLALSPVLAPALASAAPRPQATAPCTVGPLPSLDRTPCPAPAAPPTPAPASAPTSAPTSDAAAVTVRPGDTLWSIAAAELARAHRPTTPAAVAARWPAWWQANRAAVGPDPDLIRPGTTLRPPTPEELP